MTIMLTRGSEPRVVYQACRDFAAVSVNCASGKQSITVQFAGDCLSAGVQEPSLRSRKVAINPSTPLFLIARAKLER